MTLANIPQTVITIEPANLKRWTVQDYHRMSELGLLSGDRTELITGQITLMAAKGTLHVTSLHLLANILRDRLGNLALVRTQDPVHLDDFSEPEPDLDNSILDEKIEEMKEEIQERMKEEKPEERIYKTDFNKQKKKRWNTTFRKKIGGNQLTRRIYETIDTDSNSSNLPVVSYLHTLDSEQS